MKLTFILCKSISIEALHVTYDSITKVDCSNSFNKSTITTYHCRVGLINNKMILANKLVDTFYCVTKLCHDNRKGHWFKSFVF